MLFSTAVNSRGSTSANQTSAPRQTGSLAVNVKLANLSHIGEASIISLNSRSSKTPIRVDTVQETKVDTTTSDEEDYSTSRGTVRCRSLCSPYLFADGFCFSNPVEASLLLHTTSSSVRCLLDRLSGTSRNRLGKLFCIYVASFYEIPCFIRLMHHRATREIRREWEHENGMRKQRCRNAK